MFSIRNFYSLHNLKRLLIFISVFTAFAGICHAQINVWRWQNPLPEGDFLYAVQMFSLNSIYACGENGTFMRTSDGGQTWDLQTNVLKFKTTWYGLSFSDLNYGMVCGDSGRAIKTTDGGSTWNLMQTKTQSQLNSIVVIDTNIALTVALGGSILRTTDGGATWNPIIMENMYALYSIRKLRPDFLITTGYAGTILISVDTGKSWKKLAAPYANNFYNACFTADSTATIIADNGLILHTANGVWQKEIIDSNAITATLRDIDGKDPNILAMVGDYGTMLYTTDGGNSWTQSYIGTNEHIKGISFFDAQNATAVGRDGVILRSTDGGKDWFFVPQTPEYTTMYSVAFPKGDTSLGIAVGKQGTIKRTTNGGKLWSVIPSGTVNTLRGVTFSDSITAFAVGDYGTILKSTDGGATWNPTPSSTSRHLYSISFATPVDGLAVGDSNTVLKTYSAGEFWIREFFTALATHQSFEYFRSVSYPDKMHAFITGFNAYYLSSNGGVDWLPKSIDGADTLFLFDTSINKWVNFPDNTIYELSFADSLHGVIITSFDNGPGPQNKFWFARFTNDGGLTLHPVRTPNSIYINGVQYMDNKHATIVGDGGYIGHTSDGGLTVNQQTSNTVNNLYGVGFGTVQAGNAVGIRGNIMRITTDELPPSSAAENPVTPPKITTESYPNPFTQFTTIQYSLPSPGSTIIEIFTIDGKLLATFETEFQSPGEHSIRFDRGALSAGTYMSRITSNGVNAEGKLIIEN